MVIKLEQKLVMTDQETMKWVVKTLVLEQEKDGNVLLPLIKKVDACRSVETGQQLLKKNAMTELLVMTKGAIMNALFHYLDGNVSQEILKNLQIAL